VFQVFPLGDVIVAKSVTLYIFRHICKRTNLNISFNKLKYMSMNMSINNEYKYNVDIIYNKYKYMSIDKGK